MARLSRLTGLSSWWVEFSGCGEFKISRNSTKDSFNRQTGNSKRSVRLAGFHTIAYIAWTNAKRIIWSVHSKKALFMLVQITFPVRRLDKITVWNNLPKVKELCTLSMFQKCQDGLRIILQINQKLISDLHQLNYMTSWLTLKKIYYYCCY